MFLAAASGYVGANTMYGRITVRSELIKLLNRKMATTSYPNLEDEKFKKLSTKASGSTDSNSAATEAVWNTLTQLLTNTAGFIIYVLLLTNV